MSRLIDADALQKEYMYEHDGKRLMLIDTAPTIEERKTGEWMLDDEYIDCSACKREKWSRVPYEGLVKRFKFCPNCGADMRGEA